jgi:hypothetical protein
MQMDRQKIAIRMDRWIEGLTYVEDKQRQGSYNRLKEMGQTMESNKRVKKHQSTGSNNGVM